MWMDIVVSVIFVISTAVGFRRGFVHTFIHTAGWILSIVLGFAWYTKVEDFLQTETSLYFSIYDKIANQIATGGSPAATSVTTGMPLIIQEFFDSLKNSVASAFTSGIADFIFKVICFLLVVIVIRLIFLFLTSLFSKKHNEGFLGFVDGVFGLMAGALKGLLLIFLLLAILVPVISLSSGDSLTSALASSKIAGVLYDNNYLLLLLKNVF